MCVEDTAVESREGIPMAQRRPHWTRAGTLLMAVPRREWPPPTRALRLDALSLRPKRELHLTIVGRALGADIADAAAADSDLRRAVDRAVRDLDWRWTRLRTWQLLAKNDDGAMRHALIELVELPAMADFHARLGALLDRALPVPPPHVTLWTAGDARGIGVPDPDTLERLTLREVAAEELAEALR